MRWLAISRRQLLPENFNFRRCFSISSQIFTLTILLQNVRAPYVSFRESLFAAYLQAKTAILATILDEVQLDSYKYTKDGMRIFLTIFDFSFRLS